MNRDPDGGCQMKGCTRKADRTMTFRAHEEIDVCNAHYRRNRLLRHGVIAALSVTMAGLGLAVYWLVF